MKTWQLIIFGVTVHLIFFYSIFDIYFTTPLVHGMTPYVSNPNPPAKRLVLFVTDGLRADKFFEPLPNGKPTAPYLRSIIENRGVWGVSHTRVPTESRPGHVAIIAGFYEDVSAVAKGWKENPVEFDSVFNESSYTWSWGSPDILPMFAKGASGDHVFMDYYPSENEDFAAADSSKLDTWVFDKVKIFLMEAEKDQALMKKLSKDKVVFFLHLLGLDTNGHSHKPFSLEYLNNIATVDDGIQEIVGLLEDFYHHDNRTAYIVTADHGMTDWGSHGAGHPSETLTPLVAWGAGIRHPRGAEHNTQTYDDGFAEKWKLDKLQRSDVQQADMSPLMAALLGIPYPVNSVGVLPLETLDIPLQDQAEAMFSNAQQILAQFKIKMELKKKTTLSQTFRPFLELTEDKQVLHVRKIKNLIKERLFEDAIEESQQLMALAFQGLGYYQNYDRFFLGLSITAGFVGWVFYILTLILQDHVGLSYKRTFFDELNSPFLLSRKFIQGLAVAIAIVIILLLLVQSLPWTYFLYCLVPVLLWKLVLESWPIYVTAAQRLWNSSRSPVIGTTIFCLLILEAVVAGFFYREIFSIGFVALGVWPLLAYKSRSRNQYVWLVTCLLLSVFPLLPVVGRQSNYNVVLVAGILAFIAGCVIDRKYLMNVKGAKIRCAQLTVLLVAIYNLWSVSSSIHRKEGLPGLNQILSWSILVSSSLFPLLSPTQVLPRLFSIVFAFFPVYLLLSLLQEGLFIICFCIVLFSWIQMEKEVHIAKEKNLLTTDFSSPLSGERHLVAEDIRRSVFYIFFILVAFYSTGNIASINSFEPAAVYCFLTVFNPFVMGGLLMLKNILPLVLVACSFQTVQILTHIPTRALFMIVMIMSDIMALNWDRVVVPCRTNKLAPPTPFCLRFTNYKGQVRSILSNLEGVMEEDTISTVKMDDSGGERGNLSFGMPSMSGEPVVITYTTESTEDAAQLQEKSELKTQDTTYTETSHQDTEAAESDSFSEALAGEQLLQMANAIVMEQGQMGGVEENQHEIIQTVDENGTVVKEMQIVRNSQGETMGQLQTMAEYTDEDGAIHQVPVKLDNDNQLVQLVPVSTEDGNQVYIQVLNPDKTDGLSTEESPTEIQEVLISQNQLRQEMISQDESMDGQEITIENVQEMSNYKTQVMEDGTVQIYMLEDKSKQQRGLNKTLMNIISPAKVDTSGPPASSLMTIQAKKYRDVATQITVFPKFSRQGLFDVSTQVTSKEIQRDPKLRSLPNGTTIIQNSIVNQSESTIILNAGSENEMILHKCTICGKVYKNKQNWQGHIKIHAQEKVYMCGYCGKIYPRGSLSTHLRTHSELRQIAVFENLPDHLKRKNYKQAPGMVFPNEEASIIELSIADVACEIDPDLFPPPAAEVVTAPSTIVPANDASLPEPAAESEVFTENDIPAKMHMEVEAEAEIQEGTKTKFIYKCNVCGKEYNNKSNCHRHLKSHTDTKGFKCGYCGKAFTHRYEVRMHCRTHTGERPYKCPICTRGFNESGNLRRHMKIHEGDNSPFKCGVCFKGFNDTLRLNAHMKVHTGEIVCDVCNKKFGKISDLYRHIKIHSGDRPYKCDLCGKTFCQKVNLITHKRTHTGQKAFRCDYCGLGFSRKTILQQHMKTHLEDEEDFSVERTAVRPGKGQVEINMEADVIEHMEALSNELVEDGEMQTTDIQDVVLEDGEEVITEATSHEIAAYKIQEVETYTD